MYLTQSPAPIFFLIAHFSVHVPRGTWLMFPFSVQKAMSHIHKHRMHAHSLKTTHVGADHGMWQDPVHHGYSARRDRTARDAAHAPVDDLSENGSSGGPVRSQVAFPNAVCVRHIHSCVLRVGGYLACRLNQLSICECEHVALCLCIRCG